MWSGNETKTHRFKTRPKGRFVALRNYLICFEANLHASLKILDI